MSLPSRFGSVLGLVAAVAVFSSPRETCAAVRTLTPGGCNPVHWAQTCVFVTTDGVASGLFDLESATQHAVAAWAAPGESFLSLEYVPAAGPREAGVDGWQTITVRADRWCRPATATEPEICYDASANAITTLTYVHDASDPSRDGRILDADIELNAVNAAFYDADVAAAPRDGRRPTDLRNTLTHELGHLQGLDHTCRGRDGSMPACARDEAGETVALCDDVEERHATREALAVLHDATMYPVSRPSETQKRTPEADDFAGIVGLYPAEADPNVCALPVADVETLGGTSATPPVATVPPNVAGCNAAGRTDDAWVVGFALLGLLRRRSVQGSRA